MHASDLQLLRELAGRDVERCQPGGSRIERLALQPHAARGLRE